VKPSKRAEGIELTEIPIEKVRVADLTDFEAVKNSVQGMDVVVHMAADASGVSWESVLENNIEGSYHVFEACRIAGVKRIIYASSNQVVFGYARQEPYRQAYTGSYEIVSLADHLPIRHDQPTRPLNFYSCSKIFGEALAHMYSQTHGLSCLVLRVGWVTAEDRPYHLWGRIAWCSQRDIVQLVECCINAPESLRFDIFFGQSDNTYNLVDIEHARQVLGYEPQDNVEDHLPPAAFSSKR
jgi:nucleoside-diphosphate-sugar epimerase